MDTIFGLNAVPRSKMAENTKIFSMDELEYYAYIHLPSELSSHIQVYQVDEVAPNPKRINVRGFMHRNDRRPWIKIVFGILDSSIGRHIYKLSCIDIHTNDLHDLYISYIIQNDHPDTPYIYMNCSDKQ